MAKMERRTRRKVCKFCADRVEEISLRDDRRIARYITDRGKMVARRISGNCSAHQRELTRVIKQARFLALLPYTADHGR